MADSLASGIILPDYREPGWGTTVTANFQRIHDLVVALQAGGMDPAIAILANFSGRIDLLEAELAATLGGHIGFETKALMDADLAHAAGTLAEVTNDATPANNGVYRKTGASGAGSWVASAFDPVTQLQGQINELAGTVDVVRVSELTRVFPPYAWAVVDQNGVPVIAVSSVTGLASVLTDQLPGTALLDEEYRWGIADLGGKILFAIRHDGSLELGTGIRGRSYCYTKGASGARDVYVFYNGAERRISFGGADNFGPQLVRGQVRYLSEVGGVVSEQVRDIFLPPLIANIATLHHIPGYGQSLSVGAYGTPLSTVVAPKPDQVFQYNAGILTLGNNHSGAYLNNTLPDANIQTLEAAVSETQETPLIQLGNRLADSLDPDEGVLVGAHGIGGSAIAVLSKGSVPYANLIKGVTRAYNYARDYQLVFSLPGIDYIQGEADSAAAEAYYYGMLQQLQLDLKTDINAIRGGAAEVLLFIDQIANWTHYNLTTSWVPLEQLRAAIDFPTRFKLVGPKYFLVTVDGTHLAGQEYSRLGAYHGRAFAVEMGGGTWLPLYAVSAVRTGNTVVLTYHNPSGTNLALDTVLVTDPGNKGFRWLDNGDGNAVTIVSVTPSGTDTVTIVLSDTPTGTGQKIGIADIGTSGADAGPTTGPRCNLRDSSADVDALAFAMYNWACHQRIFVTV